MISLNLRTSVQPVDLTDGDNVSLKLELREMLASQRDAHMDSMGERVRIVDGKIAGIKKYDGLMADLLSRCLFYREGDKAGKSVEKSVIQSWPAGVVSSLYKEAQTLNKLNEEKKEALDEESKNA